ncbi:hypothetical protein LB505_005740 [Fusarium chuoi]|nr:hypothetical protein LB505_005740 [Fusarium chuoi]
MISSNSDRPKPATAKWGAACAQCSTAKAKCIRSNNTPGSKCDRVAGSSPVRRHPRWSHGSKTQDDAAFPHVSHPHGYILSQSKVDAGSDVSSDEVHRRPHAHPLRTILGLITWNRCHNCLV